MCLHNTLADIEAESHPPSIILGELKEPYEYRFQLVGRDSLPRIADGEANVLFDAFDPDENCPVRWSELDGVAQKIREHLEKPRRIKRRKRRRRHDLCSERDPV